MLQNYCGDHLLRCTALAQSPIHLICLGRRAPYALHLAVLATFFSILLTCQLVHPLESDLFVILAFGYQLHQLDLAALLPKLTHNNGICYLSAADCGYCIYQAGFNSE